MLSFRNQLGLQTPKWQELHYMTAAALVITKTEIKKILFELVIPLYITSKQIDGESGCYFADEQPDC